MLFRFLGLIALIGLYFAGPLIGSEPESSYQSAQRVSTAFRETAGKVIPSVVKVTIRSDPGADDSNKSSGKKKRETLPFGDLFPDLPLDEIEGVGSGVIVDERGIVLTNHHVISDGQNIAVELHNGRQVAVREVMSDPKSDLAVLILEEEGPYQFLPFADSDELEIGDWVLAIGNPFMLESSVSAGIVSAKRRLLGKKDRGFYLQTDAAVNPGNSGGPLVNLEGKVVGINTAIASMTGGYQGIGFAIPSNSAQWIMNQLIDKGKVERAFLGAAIESLRYEEGHKFGLAPRQGVRISTPYKDSPATKAGLKSNDVILTFDGQQIDSPETLEILVESADISDTHRLQIIREPNRNPRTVDIRLEIAPDDYVGVPMPEQLVDKGQHYFDRPFGMMLIPLTADAQKRLGFEEQNGILVLSVIPASIAWKTGIRDGMLITGINGRPIHSIEDYQTIINEATFENSIDITIEVRSKNDKMELQLKK